MNTEIKIFENTEFGKVRVQIVADEPLFCLSDIASSLEYANPAKAVIDHCKGVTVLETPTNGGIQKMKFGKESEVYRLVMKSKSKKAEVFQDWVCDEVLPSIRKHGAYMTEQTIEKALTDPDFLIRLATNLKEEQQKRIEAEAKVEEMKPKALFADAVAASERSCLVAELAKILRANGVNIDCDRMFAWLRDNGYLGSKGEYYNQPTQKAMDLGLFEVKKRVINNPNGTTMVTNTTKVTTKGQIYFVQKFLGAK